MPWRLGGRCRRCFAATMSSAVPEHGQLKVVAPSDRAAGAPLCWITTVNLIPEKRLRLCLKIFLGRDVEALSPGPSVASATADSVTATMMACTLGISASW